MAQRSGVRVMIIRKIASLFCLSLLLACGEGGQPTASGPQRPGAGSEEASASLRTMRGLIEDEPRFSTLKTALEKADLLDGLEAPGPITLLAPTNAAFEALPEAVALDVLLREDYQAVLKAILSYHITAGTVTVDTFEGRSGQLDMMSGQSLSYDGDGSVVVFGQPPGTAVLVLPDIKVSDGVVHVIDAVLLPPSE